MSISPAADDQVTVRVEQAMSALQREALNAMGRLCDAVDDGEADAALGAMVRTIAADLAALEAEVDRVAAAGGANLDA